jgi:hypothetical protein
VTAVDSPFGWPVAFVSAVATWGDGLPWPVSASADLRHRLTDRSVYLGRGINPLSVSSDRIGVCAWRCARLLTRWGVTDRVGGQGVAEVYPAVALRSWQLPGTGYKHRDPTLAAAAPGQLIDELRARCPWLQADAVDWEVMAQNHDALDSLICALVGRAIELGATEPIPDDARMRAEREGWIHVPTDSLEGLGTINLHAHPPGKSIG